MQLEINDYLLGTLQYMISALPQKKNISFGTVVGEA